jgi:hypothetical protein
MVRADVAAADGRGAGGAGRNAAAEARCGAAGRPGRARAPGARIKADVATIVKFATDSREREEQGSRQMWGRVSGFPSAARTVEWAAEQFRAAGIGDVRLQPIEQEARASFWMPLKWEVRLLGDPAFGPGSSDIVLDSALPLAPSALAGGTLTAPLVYVGSVSARSDERIDVKDKIAVQLVVPRATCSSSVARSTGGRRTW